MIMTNKLFNFITLFYLIIFVSCLKKNDDNSKNDSNVTTNDFELQKIYPHDTNSFTEGLFIENDSIFESTGSPDDLQSTKSVFGVLDLKTGSIDIKAELDKKIYFGEGLAKCNNKIFQLTYKNKVCFIYDSQNFKRIGSFQFENEEGWGLTTLDNKTLIMSDGTDILTFIDAENLKMQKKLYVSEKNMPVTNLNELECVDGFVFANVYTTNDIVKINVNSGNVVKRLDLSSLYYDSKNKNEGSLEMNGIAYNRKTKTFFVTGKMWPCVYEIKIN